MNKIFLIGGLPSGFGGLETVLTNVYNLCIDDFEIKVILFDYNKSVDKNWLKNINHKVIKTSLYFRFLEKISYIYQLRKIVKKQKPSLIIGFDSKGCLFSYKAIRKIKNKCNIISWIHFSFNIFPDKEKKYISKADYHLTIAEEIKLQMIEYGIDESKISTIYNPIKRKFISIPSSPKNEKYNFIYVGRIQYENQKNIKDILYALSKIRYKYTLHLIGDGDDTNKLKELSIKLNISRNIIFHGWKNKPWNFIKTEIKNVDSLILSSNYEGFGMVLVEAISYGIFCISSDCSTGPKEIISNKNGLLYKKNSIEDLVDKLNYINDFEKPKPEEIKDSILYLYNDQYIKKLKSILKENIN